MPFLSVELLIVPALLGVLLCVFARRVNYGACVPAADQALNTVTMRRWDIVLDWVMMVAVALFVIAIDRKNVGSATFVEGLFVLTAASVGLSGAACMMKDRSGSWFVRKIAFRTILGLGLFTILLGLKVAGV